MSLSDIWRFLVELLEGDPKILAAFIVGMVAALILIGSIWMWFFKGRPHPKVQDLEHSLRLEQASSAAFRSVANDKDIKISELSRACEAIKEQLATVDQQRQETDDRLVQSARQFVRLKRRAVRVRDRYKQQADLLMQQLLDVEQQQGRFWERPAQAIVPPFLPLAERRMSIIALFNLKGGVGKTSLTAHLGAALSAAGKKVLLIDLDYQASLTHLVLTPEQVSHLLHSRKHIHRLLTQPPDPVQEAWNLITPRTRTRGSDKGALGSSYVIAAHEELDRVEEMTKAAWLIGAATGRNPSAPVAEAAGAAGRAKVDPRYALRAALHQAALAEKFDYVLLDCPPRLSMACINGLTTSDFILVPTLFDKTSRDAVGRLLELVKHLVLHQVCPDLAVLGIVGNKAFCRPKLTNKEKTAWDQVLRDAKDAWQGPVHGFKRHLPDLRAFADAAEQHALADENADLCRLFADLADEVEQQISERMSADERTHSPRPATLR